MPKIRKKKPDATEKPTQQPTRRGNRLLEIQKRYLHRVQKSIMEIMSMQVTAQGAQQPKAGSSTAEENNVGSTTNDNNKELVDSEWNKPKAVTDASHNISPQIDISMVDNPKPEEQNTHQLNTEVNYSGLMEETSALTTKSESNNDNRYQNRTGLISKEPTQNTEDNSATVTSAASRLDGEQNHPVTATNSVDNATFEAEKDQSEAAKTNANKDGLQINDEIYAALLKCVQKVGETCPNSAETSSMVITNCRKECEAQNSSIHTNSTTAAPRCPLLDTPIGGTFLADNREPLQIPHNQPSGNPPLPHFPPLAFINNNSSARCRAALLSFLGLQPDAIFEGHKYYLNEQRKHLPPLRFRLQDKSLVQKCTGIYTSNWPTWVSPEKLREMLKILTDFDFSTGMYSVDVLHYKTNEKMGAALLRFANNSDCMFVFDQMRVITALQPKITVELDLHGNFSNMIDTSRPKKKRLQKKWLVPNLPEKKRWAEAFTLIPCPQNYQPGLRPGGGGGGETRRRNQMAQVGALPLTLPAIIKIQDWLGLKHNTLELNKLEVKEKLKNKPMPPISDYLLQMAKQCKGIFVMNFPTWFQVQHYKHVLNLLTDFDWNNGIYVCDILKYSNHAYMGAVLIKFADTATCFKVFQYLRVASLLQEHMDKKSRLKVQLDIYGNGEKIKTVANLPPNWKDPKLESLFRMRLILTTLDEKEPYPNMYTNNNNEQPDDMDDMVILVPQTVPQIDLTEDIDEENVEWRNKTKSKNNDKDSLLDLNEASNDSDKTTVLAKVENSGPDDYLSELISQELMDIDINKMIKEDDDHNTDINTVEVSTEADITENDIRESVQHKHSKNSDKKRKRNSKDSRSEVVDLTKSTAETAIQKQSDVSESKNGQSNGAKTKVGDPSGTTTETAHGKHSAEKRKINDAQPKVADPIKCTTETTYQKQSDKRKRKDSQSKSAHHKQSDKGKKKDAQSKAAEPNRLPIKTANENQSYEKEKIDGRSRVANPCGPTIETTHEKESKEKKRKAAQSKVPSPSGPITETALEKHSNQGKTLDAESNVANPNGHTTETAHEKQSVDVITEPNNGNLEFLHKTISGGDAASAGGDNDGDTDEATESNCKIVYVKNLPPVNTYTILKKLITQHTKYDIKKHFLFRQNSRMKSLGECLLKFNSHEEAVEVATGLDEILVDWKITEAALDIGHKVWKSNNFHNGTPNTQALKRKRISDGTQTEAFPSQPKRSKFDDCWERAYMKPEEPDTNNYGFSKEFFCKIGCKLPLSSIVIVKNLHEMVNEAKLLEVFSLAGNVKQVTLSVDNNEYTAKIEYDHPVEAVQAVSMLNNQKLYDKNMDVIIDNTFKQRPLPLGLSGIGKGLGRCGEPVKGVRTQMELRQVYEILYEMGRMNKFESKDEPFQTRYTIRSNPPPCIVTSSGFKIIQPGVKPNTSQALEALGAVLISLDVIPAGADCTTLNSIIEALHKNPKFKTSELQKAPSNPNENVLTAPENSMNPNNSNSLVNANTNDSSQCSPRLGSSTPTNAPPVSNPADQFFSAFCRFMQKFADNFAIAPQPPDAPVNNNATTNNSVERQAQYFGNVNQPLPLPNVPQVFNPPDIPPNNLPPGNPHFKQINPNPNVNPNLQIWRPNNTIPGVNPNIAVLRPNCPISLNMCPNTLNPGMTSDPNRLPVWGFTHIESHHQAPVNPNIPSLPGAPFNPQPHVSPVSNNVTPHVFLPTPNQVPLQPSTKDMQERTAQMAAANSDKGDHKAAGAENKKKVNVVCFQNLPPSVTTKALAKKMTEIGEIQYAEITGTGRAIVLFKEYSDAEICLQLFHRSKVDGHVIDVQFL